MRLAFVDLLEFGDRHRIFHRSVATRYERNQLGNTVHFGKRDFHYTSYIAQRSFRPHRPECDDLSDLVAAVFMGAVLKHLATTVIAEIKVDIRHRDTPRI